MRFITKIALVVVFLLLGSIGISYSAFKMPTTEPRWEVLYRRAVKQINPKNKYELEWMRLHREVTKSSARNDEPEQIIALAEQAYDYALKHLEGAHPFLTVSRKRLLFQIYPRYKQFEKSRRFYMYGRLYSKLLFKEKPNHHFKKWEEFYANGRKASSSEERPQVIRAAEDAYSYAIKNLGSEHPAVVKSADLLFTFYHHAGRYKEAEPVCNQGIKTRKKIFGSNHRRTLSSMASLVRLYAAMGRKNQAEMLGKKIRQRYKMVVGEEQGSTFLLQDMAALYINQGRKKEAEPLLKELLFQSNKRNKKLGKRKNSRLIKKLAKFYLSQGRRSEAEPLLQEWAEAVKDTVWEHELAEIYEIQGKYAEAESLLKEFLKLPDEFMYPTVDSGRINAKKKLGNLYAKQKRYAEAEHLQKEVIKLQEKSLGKNHPDNIEVIRAVAVLNKLQGKYKNAESLFKEAIQLSEKVFPAHHPKAIRPFVAYIFFFFATDQYDSAFPLVQEWESRLLSRSFQELYTSSSHKVRRLYERTANFFLNTVSSLAAQRPEEKYQKYAADVILRWKQLYAEEEAFQYQQLAQSNAPEIIKLRNNLTEARIKLSQAQRQNKSEEERASLLDDYNEAETALLAETKRFKSRLEVEKTSFDKLISFLPRHSGLIEYRRFRSVDLKAKKTKELHLAALLLVDDSQNKRRFIFRDLGPFAEIGKLMDDYQQIRRNINDVSKQLQENQKRKTVAALLQEQLTVLGKEAEENNRELSRALISPLDDQVKNLKQLYIAPDGPLNLLSFASLRLPDGRFLAERQQINRLQTGRDLLEDKENVPSGKGMVAVGGINYGPQPAGKTAEQIDLHQLVTRFKGATRQLEDGFAYLKHSRVEAKNIFDKYKSTPKGARFIGDDANEYNLKHLTQPPRILHLSTHGFYLTDDKNELADEAPLLLSGLALSGANNGLQGNLDKHGDDGLLYSLEVLGLNLQGTELVSLSACDTGKGVVDYSEGVYGLVRAFRTAGAQNVLMTLTPVGDKTSKDFMEQFYDYYLAENLSPSQALHKTRLDFINHKNIAYRDPAVWSPYVLVGK